jgi:hypothetical protein
MSGKSMKVSVNGDPLVVEKFLSFGGGAFAFEAEEVVTAGDAGAFAGFQGALGGDEFWVFGAGDAGGFGRCPLQSLVMARGLPLWLQGFEPVLGAAGIWVSLALLMASSSS